LRLDCKLLATSSARSCAAKNMQKLRLMSTTATQFNPIWIEFNSMHQRPLS